MANGKLSLLRVVQKTLEAMGSDEVSSISDSVEAEQVAQLAEDAYYELLNMKEWPFLVKLTQLESVADSARPTYLKLPDAVVRIEQVKYDWTEAATPEIVDIREACWLSPQAFLNRTQSRNTELDNVEVVTSTNGIRFPIYTDQRAQWWTSFDDEYVVFDAYNNTEESTMQGSKSQVIAKCLPTFELVDDFTPDATANFFQTWLAEVKRTAFIYFRQEVSPVDEAKARRGLAVLRRDASRTNQDDGRVKFGRPSRSGTDARRRDYYHT